MHSESSEDENLNFLKEAQDSQFLNDSMFSGSLDNRPTTKKEDTPKTLRTLANDDELQYHHHNTFKVTPEFRKHIAKHLSSFLEVELEKSLDTTSEVIPKKKRLNGGIKLFANSPKFLKLHDKYEKVENNRSRNISKPVLFAGRKTEINEDLLKEITVQSEDLFSKKEIKHWSDRTKSQVFEYKKNIKGTFEFVEPAFQ